MTATEEGHEHICSRCLKKFHCTDPDDEEFEMGLCPEHRTEGRGRKPEEGSDDSRQD